MKNKHILIIEDDKSLAGIITLALKSAGYTAAVATTPQECDHEVKSSPPDLIIVDINLNLADINGLDLCKELRQSLSIPIIILSGSDDDMDKVLALSLGANNYLSKPISTRVLLSFIKTALNPPGSSQKGTEIEEEQIDVSCTTLNFFDFSLNLDQVTLSKGGELIPLTPAEFKILRVFAEHPGKVLSREQLLNLINSDDIYPRSIDRFISQLRKKIEENPKAPTLLESRYGSGYLFNATVTKKRTA